jgi:hypothetical protein
MRSPRGSLLGVLRTLAPYGTTRRMAPRAVWHLAPYGTSRRMAPRAVWHLALYGTFALSPVLIADDFAY